jgi:hypothetical protein
MISATHSSGFKACRSLWLCGLLALLVAQALFAQQSPHGQISIDCQVCHTTTGWKELRQESSFNHETQTQFPLVGRHAGVRCIECHTTLVFADAGTQCLDCHTDVHRGQFDNDCSKCHTPKEWIDRGAFEQMHESTRFPLVGLHRDLDCQACHSNGQYVNLPVNCSGCHFEQYAATTDPDHQQAHFPLDCQQCHSVAKAEWKEPIFAHPESFPLTGGHAVNDCQACHASGFTNTSTICVDCHQADYDATQDPRHEGDAFPTTCQECHSTNAWEPAQFLRHNDTNFPLTGAHIALDCQQCHVGGQYTGTPLACVECHEEDYQNAEDPEHSPDLFPTSCEACHTTAEWANATFNNHNQTAFPLTGAHVETNCLECHATGFNNTPIDCWSCHQEEYNDAEGHLENGFPHDCAQCHNTVDWEQANFNHDTTAFPLTGAHVLTSCQDCHVGGVFQGTPTDCWSCHEQDYTGVEDPNHVAEQYPQNCTICHSTVNWTETSFDHNATQFPLTGAHVQTNCLECHANGYTGTPVDCWSCHEEDYNGAEDHLAQQYPHDCALCHNTTDWDGATFNHNDTQFPLTGAHVQTNCLECHVGGVFEGTPVDCWSCHQTDFEGADDPNHVEENYPHDCTVCHSTSEWGETTFDHNNTQFPLTGAHVQTNCLECHASGYSGTPTDCWSCHEADYNDADDHVEQQYPHNCEMCHNTSDWDDATFNHNNTQFPLTGAHVQTNCLECHAGGYGGTPTDCWSCHQDDYNDADDHVEQQFPHDCALCHNTTDWDDADFNHNNTQFPLTGAHIETNCLECHAGGYSGTPTDCWSCHQEDYNDADDHVEDNYPHDCTLCHNTTDWEDDDFNHDNTDFPLTGRHRQQNCGECHVNGQFEGTPTDCWSCHQEDYEDEDEHVEENFPHDCTLCHNTSGWDDDRFSHAHTHFPLLGAHATAHCLDCHVDGNYVPLPMECTACHQVDFDNSQDPDHGAAGFATTCADCHGFDAWDDGVFDHSLTGFPLVGAHVGPECISCHATSPYDETSNVCLDCHGEDLASVEDPDHTSEPFGQNCAVCHTATQWEDAEFDHALASFQLTGAHLTAECAQCHAQGYTGTPDNCVDCHITDFNNAEDPNHVESNFSQSCNQCHNTVAWSEASYDHSISDFPLTGAHVAVACLECHVGGTYSGTPQECLACHTGDFTSTTDPNHTDAGFSMNCVECHTTAEWSGGLFDHSGTGFDLVGSHLEPTCAQCHTSGSYENTSPECISCHLEDFQNSINPNHTSAGYPLNCEMCHTPTQWADADFDHNQSDFPLTGAHIAASCASCHDGGIFDGLETACASCHLEDYQESQNPNHGAAHFGTNCVDCHNTVDWQAEYDHSSTGFPLTGAHIGPSCVECHTQPTYEETSSECLACHEQDYNEAEDPPHAGQYPTTCAECHTTNSWEGASFDHNQTTFPLTGAHVLANCAQCHDGGIFAGTESACVACHEANYNSTQSPAHAQAGFGTNCEVCHNTSNWHDADFDHNLTNFPLTGSHIETQCLQCHSSGQYDGLPSQCAACHMPDYQSADDPDHVGSGFPQNCEQCHFTTEWSVATYDHNLSQFRLTGAHLSANCQQCHATGYTGTPDECVACHIEDYNDASNPDHSLPAFSHECNSCHTTTRWEGASFNHSLSSFPLTGAHVSVACLECHVGGQYSGIPDQCASCHLDDYQGTINPDHELANFSQNCQQCHTTNNWSANYNHNATGFPLTGAHVGQSCIACHTSGPYNTQSSECISCHLDDRNNAEPDHSGFPTNCAECHSTSNWDGASFDHSTTDFPLTGAHVSLACLQCHSGGVYNGLSSQCVDCHEADYNSSVDPDHSDAGFSTTCNTCHTTSNWSATYNHNATGFPLTGAHVGQSCVACHTSGPYSNQSSECISCHLDDRNGAEPDHSGFPTSCQECHSTSSWDGASFDHSTTDFPLTGAHVSLACLQCHSGGVYNGLSSQCVDCHEADYNASVDPDHSDAGFSTTCNTCHTTSNWSATYNHNATGFPLTGAHVGQSCVACHTSGPYSNQSSECISCHLDDRNGAEPDHSGFPTNCAECHSTSNWDATFDHSTTDFPLTGAHVSLACLQCHSGGVYNGLPSQCVDCHEADYNTSVDPDHSDAGFNTTCNTCHTTSNWSATYNHNATGFPLTGAHVGQSCISCHTSGPYNTQSSECISCHSDDRNNAEPDHSGFPDQLR